MGQIAMLLEESKQQDIVNYMPNKEVIESLANYFSAFSDSTRLKILSALAISKMCVSDISMVLDINQTTVSHQLKILKDQGLLKCIRDGKVILYSVATPTINDVMLSGVDYLLEQ